MFFFEKKNQKTFMTLDPGLSAPIHQSLFASFSSEKEETLA
jgi:hypothetical protein